MMFDRNGLELSEQQDTLNSYKFTSVNLTTNKYRAYARASVKNSKQWSMYDLGEFHDPRDAAFVAQEFAKQYDRGAVRQMVTDEVFYQVAREFRENIEIPEWVYPAEGLLIEDIKNDYGYKTNYVSCAREALVEVVKVFQMKPPALKDAKRLIAKVEDLFKAGCSYRDAARQVMGVAA